MSRGLFNWLFTSPKPDPPKPVFGGENWTRLKVLKNSVRNCKPSLSSGPKFVVLNIAMSQLLIPALRSVASTRDSSPKPHAAGAVKQFGLIHVIPCGVTVWGAPLWHPGTTFGRRAKFCVKPAFERGVEPLKLIGRGNPFWNVVTPSTPQPETILLVTPETSDMYFCP